jgi:hypothetical protein
MDDTREPGAHKGNGLLEGDLFCTADGGLQVDDVYACGCRTGSPQASEQLPPSLRRSPTADHDASRLCGRKCIDKDLRSLTDLGKYQKGRARQFTAQQRNKFPEAKRHRPAAHIVTDDDDRRMR